MAKVRNDLKSSSAAARKKKANNAAATPSKTSNGKITKNRKTYKGEDILHDYGDYFNRYNDIQSKIRLCFVKIRRNHTTDMDVKTSPLREQCTDCMDKNKSDISELNVFPSSSDTNYNKHLHTDRDSLPDSYLLRTVLGERIIEPNQIPKLQLPNGKRCLVKLKKLKMPAQREGNENEITNMHLSIDLIGDKEKEKNDKYLKTNNESSNMSINKCVVRINKLRTTAQNVGIKNFNVYDDNQSLDTFPDNRIRKVNKSYKNYKDDVIKKSVVKILKLPLSIQKDLNDRLAARESLLASQIISPTLDNEKRKAFQKLSLSFHKNTQDNQQKFNCSKIEESTENPKEQKLIKKCKNPNIYFENDLSEEDESNKENRNSKKAIRSRRHNKTTSNCNNHKLKDINKVNIVNMFCIGIKDAEKNCKLINNINKNGKTNISRQRTNVVKEINNDNFTFKKPLPNSKPKTKTMINKTKNTKSKKDNTLKRNHDDMEHNNSNIFSKPSSPEVTSLKEKSPSKHKATVAKVNDINSSSIFEFHPQRNSTMCIADNLLQLSNCPDDCMVLNNEKNNTTNSYNLTGNQTKTNKFFHRHEDANLNRSEFSISKNKRVSKKSSLVRREKVYDFLSQSQTSECDGIGDENGRKKTKPFDPTADIVKKLIAEGKVAVATSKKGTGKTCFKRNNRKPKKDILKKEQLSKPNRAIISKKQSKNIKNTKKQTQTITSEDFVDHLADDHFMDNHEPTSTNSPLHLQSPRHTYSEQEGTFSNLARSVLINQAKRNDPQRLKAQRLLSMAKKLISTPNNKKIPTMRTTMNVDISPIQSTSTIKTTLNKASPWRVDEDAHMPRVFNFSRSSSNLPSYSSDFIPPTPKKDKTNTIIDRTQSAEVIAPLNRELSSPRLMPQEDGICPLPNTISTPSHSVNSSIPSFSSNDSNAENKTPPGREHLENNDENSNIFNLKQFPNPRRTLNYRSPLKAINITEVVQLPQLEMSKILKVKKNIQNTNNNESEESHQYLFGFEDFLTQNDISRQESLDIVSKDTKEVRTMPIKQPPEDLFGFEDFLTQNEISSQEAAVEISTKDPKQLLEKHRHKLRQLKPDTRELEKSLHQHSINNGQRTDKTLFTDENNYLSKPQRTLKEMLCSTMIHEKPTTSRKAQEQRINTNQYFQNEETNDSAMLFKDLEPETTFNEEDPHRTYIRPFKRKRRLNENRLIFALESDESDTEENLKNNLKIEKKKPTKNQSHETDTSTENQAPQNKRKKRQPKDKPELINFVEEFNEMCKEVENYELIVEKSV